jgi:hypothetical protein
VAEKTSSEKPPPQLRSDDLVKSVRLGIERYGFASISTKAVMFALTVGSAWPPEELGRWCEENGFAWQPEGALMRISLQSKAVVPEMIRFTPRPEV